MRRRLVHSDGLAVQLDHVHDLDGIVRVLLSKELDKTVALNAGEKMIVYK